MSLDAALSVATSGLATVNQQLRLVSQNVANASTANYARQIANTVSLAAGGMGIGVQAGAVQRVLDQQLQATLFGQNALVSGGQTAQTALQKIDSIAGTPGQGSDLAGLLGKVQDTFSGLVGDPSSTARQRDVVTAASGLAAQINALSNAVTAGRQEAQHDLVRQIGALNSNLARIGTLSREIVELKAQGLSTADLENQRDAARDDLSRQVTVRAMEQPGGDLLLMTPSGLRLPTSGSSAFSTTDANPGPLTFYPAGGLGAITLGGLDVTSQLQGGAIGSDITLRDTTLPSFQAGLDEFAQTLSTRMDGQGLRLFSDGSGNVPSSTGPNPQDGYVGYAAAIRVNPAVVANPALVRDGTHSIAGGGNWSFVVHSQPGWWPCRVRCACQSHSFLCSGLRGAARSSTSAAAKHGAWPDRNADPRLCGSYRSRWFCRCDANSTGAGQRRCLHGIGE